MSRLIAALDCTQDTFSVALMQDDVCLAEQVVHRPRAALSFMVSCLQECCRNSERQLTEIGGVGVTVGPGSFTGVRLGILVARTLSQCLKVKSVPISTLEALAQNGPAGRPVAAACDARRGEIFAAVYHGSEVVVPAAARSPEETAEALAEVPRLVVVGNALKRYGEILPGEAMGPEHWAIRASAVGRLAAARWHQAVDWGHLEPDYLRPPDVQVAKPPPTNLRTLRRPQHPA